jgi:hypothetical protein
MTEARTRIRQSVAKTMFAISGNQCYYLGCEERVAHPSWEKCNGEIAHICGERQGAARYDKTLSVKDRNDCWNLMVLCPKHHKLIDQLEPRKYPVDRLRTMKEQHEQTMAHARDWATGDELDMYVTLLLQPVYVQPEIVPESPVVRMDVVQTQHPSIEIEVNRVGIEGTVPSGEPGAGVADVSVLGGQAIEHNAATSGRAVVQPELYEPKVVQTKGENESSATD